MDGDAEWVGVDFEFGRGTTTTPRPRPATRAPPPRPQPRPARPQPRPATEPPHDAPDVAAPRPTPTSASTGVLAGAVGGVLGVVLVGLIVYMFVLRRKLMKAKSARGDNEYRLRVEDVAHLTNIDETSNTYVNTTDLQKLVSSVRAKKKAEERVPLPPRQGLRTPATPGTGDNTGFKGDGDVVVLRPPMPPPISNSVVLRPVPSPAAPPPHPTDDALYANVQEDIQPSPLQPQPSPRRKRQQKPSPVTRVEPPKIRPPPPPEKKKPSKIEITSPVILPTAGKDDQATPTTPLSPTVVARPAPPPPMAKSAGPNTTSTAQGPILPPTQGPVLSPTQASSFPHRQAPILPPTKAPIIPSTQGPILPSKTAPILPPTQAPISPPTQDVCAKPQPPAATKPPKPTPSNKPAPPKAPKPGVLAKGRALPRLALIHSESRSSMDSCDTPETSDVILTPETAGTASISAKIAFLEGKMKTPVQPRN